MFLTSGGPGDYHSANHPEHDQDTTEETLSEGQACPSLVAGPKRMPPEEEHRKAVYGKTIHTV